jgi:predicted HAD superfamily Cof-like phosphohydrolase
MTPFECIKEFRKTFQLHNAAMPSLPPDNIREFQADMIHDEATEMYEADTADQYLDGIVDVIYFALGAAVEAGFTAAQIEEHFMKVHTANMNKTWTVAQHEALPNKFAYAITPVTVGGEQRYIVRRSNDGKVVKPPGWAEPTRTV